MLGEEWRSRGVSPSEIRVCIAELFPPAMLFSPGIMSLPILLKEFRKWLDLMGANLQQHSSRSNLMNLATNIYSEREDREVAIELVKDIISGGRRKPSAASSAAPNQISEGYHEDGDGRGVDKTAHNIGMRFKESYAKFSGSPGESWLEYVAEYQQVARDYCLGPPQKLQYLHNILRGDAKRFYLDRVDGYATGFQHAVSMVEVEYNSLVRPNGVKTYVSNLRMSSFAAEGLEQPASLEKT